MRLGIIVPALDEEEAIGTVVERIIRSAEVVGPFRLVVCDNNSSDNTAAVAHAAGAEVVQSEIRGYGAACLRAIEHLGEWPEALLFLDGDGSSRPEEMESLIDPLKSGQAELVLGQRTFTSAVPLAQRWGTRFAVRLVNLRWGCSFQDMGPFRSILLKSFRRLGMQDQTWGWTIEMQILAVLRGVEFIEIPVAWEDRIAGRSKISGTVSGIILAGSRILWTVGKYSFRQRLRADPEGKK